MAEYSVVFARSARKELEKLRGPVSLRILAKIEALAGDPRPVGCRKIEGTRSLWRIRVGDYRVVYAVDDQQRLVDIIAVRHRRQAYR